MKKIIINFKTILISVLVICILGVVFVKNSTRVKKSYFLMDTYVTIEVNGFNSGKAVDAAYKELKMVESKMNSHKQDSALNKYEFDRDLLEVLNKAVYYGDLSGGLFDVTVKPLTDLWNITSSSPVVPSDEEIIKAKENVDYKQIKIEGDKVFVPQNTKLDLGGIGKGYAADKAVMALKRHGITDAVINLGGNVYAVGTKDIGIQNPISENGDYMGILTITDCSVATSGAYERYFEQDGKIYHHIIDPFTGYPAKTDLHSATVVDSSSADADSLSTILFMMGKDKAISFAKENNISYVLIDKSLNVYCSADVKLEITDNKFKR